MNQESWRGDARKGFKLAKKEVKGTESALEIKVGHDVMGDR